MESRGSSSQQQQANVLAQGLNDLYTELWKACAGPVVEVLKVRERGYYFPQGHMEQGLLFLLCALCPQDVSKVRVGKLSPNPCYRWQRKTENI